MPNGTVVMRPLPETWGMDSHACVYMNNYVYSIGGYNHYSIGTYGDICGFSSNYKYGPMSGDFYRIDTSGTNSSADWDWKFINSKLAMTCAVAVFDRYIYIIGGFHKDSKFFFI